jgi:hypothetical protein
MVQLLQIVSAALWGIVAVMASPSIWRTFAFRHIEQDDDRNIFFYMGLIQVGAGLRWWTFPHAIDGMGGTELATWSAIYLSLIVLAIRTMIVMRRRPA